jgi:hypothetical protein
MISDNLLINLKILSKIQKNGRIARSFDGIISLETDAYIQPLKRFLSSDSRKQAIFEINSIITESITALHNILNSKYMNKNFCQTDEYQKNCENLQLLMAEMELARAGIENLKFTYQNDQNIASQLDIIILKINTTVKDVTQKLFYFQSFIPSQNAQNTSHQPSQPTHIPQTTEQAEMESIRIDYGTPVYEIDMNDMNQSHVP